MQKFKRVSLLASLILGCGMFTASPSVAVEDALDHKIRQITSGQHKFGYRLPLEAYRQGVAAYRQGWFDLAYDPIRFAADKGIIGAQLTLARMYANGEHVRQNDAKAFQLYMQIYKDYHGTTVRRGSPAEKHISEAYIQLGKYYLNGLPFADLKPDLSKALNLLEAAAINFSAPEAQYMLAKMYISGKGTEVNLKRAVRWLNNASSSHDHAPSQAMLAELLWQGHLMPRQPVRSLALITLAKDNASAKDAKWINAIYDTIISESDVKQKDRAAGAVANWMKRKAENRLRVQRVMQRQRELARGNKSQPNYTGNFLRPKSYYGFDEENQAAPAPHFRNIDTPFAFGQE